MDVFQTGTQRRRSVSCGSSRGIEEQVEAISALDRYRNRSHGDKKAKDAPDPMHGRVST
jgi:hypothetical protein